MKVTNRDSIFELLRLILMLMIVIHHGIVHGLGLSSLGYGENAIYQMSDITLDNLPLFLITNSFLIVAVNCFILISGYFGIHTTWKKIITILIAVFFYTLIFTTSWHLVTDDIMAAMRSIFFLSHGQYWFITNYIFLMLFAPLLNSLFKCLNSRYIIIFLSTLIILSSYFGFIWGYQANNNGYTLMQFIMLYCIGRYLNNYKFSINKSILLVVYMIGSILNGILSLYFVQHNADGTAWKMTYYNNPLVIITSIAFFLFFTKCHIQSQTINRLAKSALAVYLFQCSKSINTLYNQFIHQSSLSQNDISGGGILLIIIILALSILIISLMIDQIQLFINNKIVKMIENRHPNFMNAHSFD